MTATAAALATAVGGRLAAGDGATAITGMVSVDTRLLAPGDVFLALRGEQVDGGRFVRAALDRGAVGVIAVSEHAGAVAAPAFAIAVDDPLAALHGVARARRAELDCPVVGVTGIAGKTTTTDLLAALLETQVPTHATRHGFNTEQGVAATIAGSPRGTGALVAELGMSRQGEIAARAAELRPTAGIVTNVGPDHLETAGTTAAVARNKAELIAGLPAGAPCLVPAGEPLLDPHLRSDLDTITVGPGGDVVLRSFDGEVAEIDVRGERVRVAPGFSAPHNLANLTFAVALVRALGFAVPERVDVRLSPLRWELRRLGEVEIVLDCAKTSPLSLAAAIDALAAEPARRRIAVLGPLPDLGAEAERFHREAGAHAAATGIDVLVAVGAPATEYLAGYVGATHAVSTAQEARHVLERIGRPGDRVLVKGSVFLPLEGIAG